MADETGKDMNQKPHDDTLQDLSTAANRAVNEGRFDAARDLCARIFARDPGNLSGLWLYTYATRYAPDDPVLARIERYTQQPGLSDPLRSQLFFMIGKAYDDMGRVERAFDAIVEANAIKGVGVDDDALDKLTDQLVAAVEAAPRIALERTRPRMIFVLGMPRSGTSLTAQMLGAHPEITNMGERVALGPALAKAGATGNPHLAFLDGLSATRLQAARAQYLDALPKAGIIIDKMPENYWFAWAIPMLFPDAIILHLTRDRLATCWSCFRNDFRAGHQYSYKWTSTTRQYDRHLRLCDLGRGRAGRGWVPLRLDELTARPRDTLAPVLDLLGLDWTDAVARPEQAGGSMPTLSKWQVRQGIDPKISDRWRAYLPLIMARLEGG